MQYSEKFRLFNKRKDILEFIEKRYQGYTFTGVNSILVNVEMLQEETKE